MPDVSLGPFSTTLLCGYDSDRCGAKPVLHISWYDENLTAPQWENSLACQEHYEDAVARGWTIGWRHRVLPACAMPGSILHIATEGNDEWGFPITWCSDDLDPGLVIEATNEQILEIVNA